MKILIITLLTLTSLNSYAITCKDKNTTLDLSHSTVTITSNGQRSIKAIKDSVWDGHLRGIITGRGFSITYENHFGCIRNFQYTGAVSERRRNVVFLNFGNCAGGSTPDELCLR
jgi:hypothetical protein